MSRYQTLVNVGAKFDLDPGDGNAVDLIPQLLSDANALEQASPGSVASLEDYNEPGEAGGNDLSYDGYTVDFAANNYEAAPITQEHLWDSVHDLTDPTIPTGTTNTYYPALSSKPVLEFCIGYYTLTKYVMPDSYFWCDYQNIHPYAANGIPPGNYLAAEIAGSVDVEPPSGMTAKPIIITETGYPTIYPGSPNLTNMVAEPVEEEFLLDTLFDEFSSNVAKTYIYELMDRRADFGDSTDQDHYGIFYYDGTPKPAATAIGNLMKIINDGSTQEATSLAPLQYALTSTITNSGTGNAVALIEKSTGAYDIVIWSEPAIWDSTTFSMVPRSGTDTVTLSFPQAWGQLNVYDPTSGSTPILTQTNSSQISVGIVDHPIIVEVEPAPSVAGSNAAVAVGNLIAAYDGNTHAAEVTTTPAGLATTVTYNGSTTVPSAAGSYPVVATVTTGSYVGSATGTLTINSGTGSVTLGNLLIPYTGTPHAVTVTTSPAGLATRVTYNGSTTVPSAAGFYPVVATVTAPNYTGSATGTLTISTCTVTLGNLTATYNGSSQPVSVTTKPSGLATTIFYDDGGDTDAPMNAGTYPVTATVNSGTYVGSATATLTISRATATLTLANLTGTYTGSSYPVTVTTYPSGLATTVTYNGGTTAPSAAGTYPVQATLTISSDGSNYAGSATGTLTISKAAGTVSLGNLNVTYTGTAQPVTVTTMPSGLANTVTYNGSTTVYTYAGVYAVVATVTDPNYAGSATGTRTISPATSTVTLGNLTTTYNGSPQVVTVTTMPSGLATSVTYNGSVTAPSAIGSYPVLATVTAPNYAGSANGTLTIKPAPSLSTWEATYFTAQQLADPTVSGPQATPENDGVTNLLKYLYNINPTRPMTPADIAALPAVGVTSSVGMQFLCLTYRQNASLAGVTINLQSSPDLQMWTTVAPDVSLPMGTDPVTGDPIMQVGVNVTNLNQDFIRLNATSP